VRSCLLLSAYRVLSRDATADSSRHELYSSCLLSANPGPYPAHPVMRCLAGRPVSGLSIAEPPLGPADAQVMTRLAVRSVNTLYPKSEVSASATPILRAEGDRVAAYYQRSLAKVGDSGTWASLKPGRAPKRARCCATSLPTRDDRTRAAATALCRLVPPG
jgi:hypothetical protein